MTYPEAIQFLYDLRWFGLKLGLENTFKLAALAGNPQERLRFIHVAGTNGKGSTCAMLESIYRKAGLRVGLFTSPHLVSFRERIQVNRELVSEGEVVRLVGEMQSLMGHFDAERRAGFQPAGSAGIPARRSSPGGTDAASTCTQDACATRPAARAAPPTFFEVVTVMALRYFAEQNCDLVIWETGMGGRLDATNIVTPLASVITNIQFDHQEWLGHTRVEIAAEKAGIIKRGVPVITATDAPDALEVIVKTAREKNAPLTAVAWPKPTPAPSQEGNLRITATAGPFPSLGGVGGGLRAGIALPLPGEHQRLNSLLAMATVKALQDTIPVRDETMRIGLETVQWPGRLQLVKTAFDQTILLDGAHNAASADALREALSSEEFQIAIFTNHQIGSVPEPQSRFLNPPPAPPLEGSRERQTSAVSLPSREGSEVGSPKQRRIQGSTLILGVLEEKDWARMCETLAPLARRILLAPVHSARTASPETLRDACVKANPNAQVVACPSLADALKQAANDPFVVITGSLYLVGEAMELLKLCPAAGSERDLNEWSVRK